MKKIVLKKDLQANEVEEMENTEICPALSIDLFSNFGKGTRDTYQCLKEYLSSFDKVQNVTFINVNPDGIFNDEAIGFKNIINIISQSFDEIKIGEAYTQENAVVVPVYKNESTSQWLYCELRDGELNYIFNSIFKAFIYSSYQFRVMNEKTLDLELLASTDEVTGLFNQRKLTEDLERAVEEHKLNHDTFSIMFIDVDHFKSVNDNYGHIIGSKLLYDMGVVLKRILRQSDHVYRYGGDEFVVIMPNVEIKTVHSIATRVLRQLKEHTFDIENGDEYHMSISIGIAEYPTDASCAKEIIRFADEMMYQSKKSGRGRVFHVKEVADVNASSK